MVFNVAYPVHAVCELAAGGHICENDIPRVGEEDVGELVASARIPGYMEFHHIQSFVLTHPALFDAPTALTERHLPSDGSSYRTSPNATKCKGTSIYPGMAGHIPD
jgi:hypothetical protein